MSTKKGLYSLSLLIALLVFSMMLGLAGCNSASNSSGSSNGSSDTETYRYCYVTNSGDNTLGFISLDDNSYKSIKLASSKTASVGSSPNGVSVEGKGYSVYVTGQGDSTITIVNVLNKVAVAQGTFGNTPIGIDFGPYYDSYAAIASSGDGNAMILSTNSGTLTGTVNIGGSPVQTVTSNDGLTAYFSNTNNILSILDVSGTQPVLSKTISGAGNAGLDMDASGAYIYQANSTTGEVFKINLSSSTVASKITVGQTPCGVVCNPTNSNLVYATNTGSNTVSVINASTNTVTATIPVGSSPKGIDITADGAYLYVANSASNNVSVISTSSNTVTTTVGTGTAPTAVACSPY